MAPTFYHYQPVPMEEKWQERECCGRRRLLAITGVLLLLAVTVVLSILLIIYASRANSRACTDGLRAQAECNNITHSLQRQLIRAQDHLRQAEAKADTCNRTVVTLRESLEKKVSRTRELQERIAELESQVTTLNQELQKLRTLEKDSKSLQKNSASSTVISSLLMLIVPLFLLL